MYNRWLRLQTMLLPRSDLPRVEPMALWVFRNIFLPNTSKDKKKVYLSAEPLVLCHMLYVKSDPGYCITFIKRLDEGLSYQRIG